MEKFRAVNRGGSLRSRSDFFCESDATAVHILGLKTDGKDFESEKGI
jgi:hypothetical protein